MLLVSGAAVILPACDGQITVSGSVVDEEEGPIVDACIYLGDRRYSDILERYEADPETHIGCTHRSNEEGHFVATGIIAGRGNHDFWVIVWKEGYQDYYGRVWHGDGVPSSTVEVTVVLEALAPE